MQCEYPMCEQCFFLFACLSKHIIIIIYMPTIGLVGATHSLQCRTVSAVPRISGSGRHEAVGEHSLQTQRPHLRQWCLQLSRWKSALHSSHFGASRSRVHCGPLPPPDGL